MADNLDLRPPLVDFSRFADVFDSYQAGRKARRQADLADAFADGNLPRNSDGTPDYTAISNKMFSLGELGSAMTAANLASAQRKEQRSLKASETFGRALSGTLGADASGSSPAYFDRVRAAESGGDDAARASTSSATGRYQFTDGTWGDLVKSRPDLQLTPEGRSDPAQQERAVRAFTENNTAALKSAGLDATDANLYLAHFLGPQGAVHFLKNYAERPDAPAASMVGPQAVMANRSKFFGQDQKPVSADEFYRKLTSPVASAPTRTTFSGAPSQSIVPVLAAAANHPDLPTESRELAKILLNNALDDSKSTPSQKEYRLYGEQERAAGRQPKLFNDWQNENEADRANLKQVGEGYGKALNDIQKEGRESLGTMNTLQFMTKLVDNPSFYSGTGGEYATRIKRALVSIGVNDAETAAPNELFQKLSNRLVLDANRGSLGTGFSNADRDFIQAATANIGNTPEGNRAILELAMKVERRKQDVAKFARGYASAHGGKLDVGFDDALARWAAGNPMFTEADRGQYPAITKAQQGPALRKFSSPAEVGAAKLPSGTHFLDANGVERVVP